jgi:hypothetical protein
MEISPWEHDGEGRVLGYMCRTDFECELGQAEDGSRIYPSVECLKDHLKCWVQCGIVEVVVKGVRVVVEDTDP